MRVNWIASSDRWQITTTVRYTADVQEIPGVRAERRSKDTDDPTRAVWVVPVTYASTVQITTLFPDAEWSKQAKRRRKGVGEARKERLAAKVSDEVWDERLSPAQNQGVGWLLQGSGLLADDMGSGKTVMASVALQWLVNHAYTNQVLIVTTQSTLHVWEDHLRDWTDVRSFIFHGPKRLTVLAEYLEFEGAKALITTHALLRKHSRLAGFGHVPS